MGIIIIFMIIIIIMIIMIIFIIIILFYWKLEPPKGGQLPIIEPRVRIGRDRKWGR